MRVAIVHYWLVSMRGGEKVLESLCEMYPQADIFTHAYDPARISETIRKHRITTTFISRLPRPTRMYKSYLPLMPLALDAIDLQGYDLVLSSESGPAKGVLPSPEATHVCYCHTPMRYVWDMYHDYRATAGFAKRLMMGPLTHYLRQWDFATAARVDAFAANSRFVKQRVRRFYRRDARVIPPPVDVSRFQISRGRGEYYLYVGQLIPYKRADIAIEAFTKSGKPLIVVGEGSDSEKLRRMAGKNIVFAGSVPDDKLAEYYANSIALVFPGLEDFGIVPVEAMAAGRPVIAYGRGGVLDTVEDGATGVFFHEQTAAALNAAIGRFETMNFSSDEIHETAMRFAPEVFKQRMQDLIDRTAARHQPTPRKGQLTTW